MAKKGGVSGYAAQGGNARATVLTPSERQAIARTAARARWGEKRPDKQASKLLLPATKQPKDRKSASVGAAALPLALFPGKLRIADAQLSVYVLDDGKRVMAQREVLRVLTGNATGSLGRYLDRPNLQPYISKDRILHQTIRFSISGTQFEGYGYEATLLLDICDAYLKARQDKKLLPSQEAIATQAEVVIRACAKVGIIALIDEATGYQAFRKKQELQLKLQAFIAEDMQEWALMFPHEFWFELARLEGVHYSPRSRPLRWAKYIMAFVYDAVDGDIGKELRKKNPDPHFRQNHHQWLKEFGRQKVHDQIQRVVTIMKLCDDMDDFRQKFAKVFKKSAIDPQMGFTWEPGE